MVLLVYRQGSCSMIFPSANSLVILWTSTRFISSHHLWASLQERHTGAFGIWPQTCLCRPLQKGEWPWMGNPFDWPLERKVHQPIASIVEILGNCWMYGWYMEVSWNRGTPNHPFIDGFWITKTIQLFGVPPWLWKHPYQNIFSYESRSMVKYTARWWFGTFLIFSIYWE